MKKTDWKETEGTVSNVMLGNEYGREHDWIVTFTYQVDGHYYGGEFVTGSSLNYTEGSKISVKYNPANPEENDRGGNGASRLWIRWIMAGLFIAWAIYKLNPRGCL